MNKPLELNRHFEAPRRRDIGLSAELNERLDVQAKKLDELDRAMEKTREDIERAEQEYSFAPKAAREGLAEYHRLLCAHLETLRSIGKELLAANERLFAQMEHFDEGASRAPGGIIGEA